MRILRLPYFQAEQTFKGFIFNTLGRKCDEHTKNFVFLMDKDGKWRPTPTFDTCNAYRIASDWVSQHVLTINGKRENITKGLTKKMLTLGILKKPIIP
jgi:serine/threonine-protein kinase HipA